VETAYHPDIGQALYSIRALPESSDGQVRSTINQVIRYIREDACSPFIQSEAERALRLGAGDPNKGVFNLLKSSMRFKRDEKIADELQVEDARKPDTIEVLIRPVDQWLLIKLRGLGVGDCDCFHMYGACLLWALGVPCSLVTVSADPERPWEFSHVYLASYWNGVRTPLDISHGDYPGWECQNLGRVKEWKVQPNWEESVSNAGIIVGGLVAAYFGLQFLLRRVA
jgi:hypothetical protein